VEIHVLQGDREIASGNRTIGRFHLDGIPPAPRGVPQIEVTFDIDADGILSVSAKDKATGKEQSVRIEASSGLSSDEIEKMRTDARDHAAEDKKRREDAEKANSASALIYTTEKNLKDYGEKISADKKARIEAALERLKQVHNENNAAEIESAMDQLNEAWAAASEDLQKAYQEAAGGENGDPAGEAPADDEADEVKDVDYEVVDEEEEK
jgi:molecular chaperone DnaK